MRPGTFKQPVSFLYPEPDDEVAVDTVFSQVRHKNLRDRKTLGETWIGDFAASLPGTDRSAGGIGRVAINSRQRSAAAWRSVRCSPP